MTAKQKRTRIKFCGLVRPEDVQLAVDLGVEAIGFVFYSKSPRVVSADLAQTLRRLLPLHTLAVGLFVNQDRAEVAAISEQVGLNILQFHGDEPPEALDGWQLPVWRAVRMQGVHDLVKARERNPNAQAYLLDAHVASYGGAGQAFDWNLLAADTGARRDNVILSGGLSSSNVVQGIAQLRPMMVDVSSGIQGIDPRVKDVEKMRAFVRAVASVADEGLNRLN